MNGGEAKGLFDDVAAGLWGGTEAGDDDHYEAETRRHYLRLFLASVMRVSVDARGVLWLDVRAEDRGRRSSDECGCCQQ